jgi:hypothetical protein
MNIINHQQLMIILITLTYLLGIFVLALGSIILEQRHVILRLRNKSFHKSLVN